MLRAFVFGIVLLSYVGDKRGLADEHKQGPAEPPKTLVVLLRPTSVEFVDTPLSEAASSLSEKHKVKITVDETALAKARLSADEPITMQLEGLQLRSALNLMLRHSLMEWRVEGNGIVIGPEKPKKEEARPAPKSPDTPLTARIRDALKDATDFQFVDTPLNEGLDFLSDVHGIPILLDHWELSEAKIATDVPVQNPASRR